MKKIIKSEIYGYRIPFKGFTELIKKKKIEK